MIDWVALSLCVLLCPISPTTKIQYRESFGCFTCLFRTNYNLGVLLLVFVFPVHPLAFQREAESCETSQYFTAHLDSNRNSDFFCISNEVSSKIRLFITCPVVKVIRSSWFALYSKQMWVPEVPSNDILSLFLSRFSGVLHTYICTFSFLHISNWFVHAFQPL